jgi:hypothetical protein
MIIHGQMVPNSLRDSHSAMIGLFAKNFKEEINRTGLNVQELETSFAMRSGDSTPTTLSRVHTQSTIEDGSSDSVNKLATNRRIPSMSSIGISLGRTDTRSSDKSGSRVSQLTQKTSGSGSKKNFLTNWRQSRLE